MNDRVKMIVLKGSLFHEITVRLPVVKHTVRLYNIPGKYIFRFFPWFSFPLV